MALSEQLKVVFTVLDRTAAPLHAINERFHRLSMPFKEIGNRLAVLSEESGLARIGEQAREAAERVGALGERLREVGDVAATISITAGLAGLIESVRAASEYSERLSLLAPSAGLTPQQFGGIQFAGALAGFQSGQIIRGLQWMNRNIGEEAAGRNKELVGLFGALHKLEGMPLHPGMMQLMEAVSNRVHYLILHGKSAVASEVMSILAGQRMGQQLLPIFQQGWAYLLEKIKEAREFGFTPTKAQLALGREFREQIYRIVAAVTGLEYAIGFKLMPVLKKVVAATAEWIKDNKGWISTNIAGAVHSLVNSIKSYDWKGLAADFKAGWEQIEPLVHWVGGLRTAFLGLAAIELGPLIASVAMLAATIQMTPIGWLFDIAVVAAGAAFLIWKNWDWLKSKFEGFWRSMPGWAKDLAEEFAAPLLLPYEIWKHWDWLKSKFEEFNRWIPGWAKSLAAGFAAPFLVPYEIWKHWDWLKSKFEGFEHWIAGWAKTVAGDFDPIIRTIEEIGSLIDHLNPLALGYEAGKYLRHKLEASPVPSATARIPPAAAGRSRLDVHFHNAPGGTSVTSRPAPDLDLGLDLGSAWLSEPAWSGLR